MRWLLGFVLLVPVVASAGTLSLVNGDRLHGELVKLELDKVVWKSDTFGVLKISKAKVENLNTDVLVKLNGHARPCSIYGVDGGDLIYGCAGGISESTPLQSLQVLIPYEQHLAGDSTYSGKLNVAGTFQRGNKVEDDIDVRSDVRYRRGDLRHINTIEFESKSQNEAPANERLDAEYALDWFFLPRWFYYNQLGYSYDEAKAIDEAYQYGTGFGYQLFENARTAWSLQSGILWEKELYEQPDDSGELRDERLALELSSDFRYKFDSGISLFNKAMLVQSFENGSQWRLETDSGLNIPLGAGLFSEFALEYDVDNEPPAGSRREDSKLRIGIGYGW